MNTPEHSASNGERRRHPRDGKTTSTFVHRKVDEEMAVLRVDVADMAVGGVGMLSFVPLPVGTLIAVGMKGPQTSPEFLLCTVKHCAKSATGQFRSGAQIIEHLPGEPVQTRIPRHWFNKN